MIYNFYHITDVHYYSKKNFACDWRTFPQPNTEICILKSEEAFKKALKIVEEDESTDTVIITGDLTNHGEAYSHEEVKSILQEFTQKGGRPFVYPDSHDYPDFYIYGYDEKGNKVETEHLPEKKAKSIYYPFGRDKGFDIYPNDDTTFIAEILPNLYYIALGYDATANGPVFSDELIQWVKKHTEAAKEKGAVVICSTHRPIVEPSPAYKVIGKGHTFADGEKRIKELADMGIKLFFSGHTHIQCIKEITSESGNRIYSIQTSSLAGFPPKMRKITIDTEKGTADIQTIDMELPDLEMSFTEYAKKGFLGIIEGIPYNMEHNVEAFANTAGGISLPKELILKHPKIVMYLGRKLNNLTYEKVAKFSKKYNGLNEIDLADKKDNKYINLVMDLVANLYRGNAHYSPDTVEYKITMGTFRKLDRLLSLFHIDSKKLLCGFSLTEFIEPLLYNKGLDDDNVTLDLK